MDDNKININESKVYEIMGEIIEMEKKYLYDKRLKNSLDLERIKAIRDCIDKGVETDVD